MRYNTYIFDFDLTLADATKGIVLCYKTVLANHGFPIPDDYIIKRTIGMTLTDSFAQFTGITDMDILENLRNEYVKCADCIMTENTVIFDTVEPNLTMLKNSGAKCGIVTTKFAYRATQALEKYGLTHLFDVVIGNEHVSEYKPSPQGLNLAITQLSACKEDVLYIGDTVIDAQTAANCGADFAAVLTGLTTYEEFAKYNPKFILKDLNELQNILQG